MLDRDYTAGGNQTTEGRRGGYILTRTAVICRALSAAIVGGRDDQNSTCLPVKGSTGGACWLRSCASRKKKPRRICLRLLVPTSNSRHVEKKMSMSRLLSGLRRTKDEFVGKCGKPDLRDPIAWLKDGKLHCSCISK